MKKLKLVFSEFSSFEGSLFRYSLSYSFLLALFPMLIVVVMLFNNSILDIELLLEYLYRFIPESLIADFIDYITNRDYPNIVTLIVSLVLAFNLASRSIFSFMLISARKENYNIPKILIRIKSYVLFLLLVLSVTAIALAAGFFHYPLAVTLTVGLFIVFLLLYKMVTFEKRPSHYGIVGAVFSTAVIILLSQLLFTLINYLTSYQSVYGPMASLVIALLSIYVVSSVIYFGYCLNLVYGPSYPRREYKNDKLYGWVITQVQVLKKKIKVLIKWKQK